MTSPEQFPSPPEEQKSPSSVIASIKAFMGGLGASFKKVLLGDPQKQAVVDAFLTGAFVEEFKTEYRRMLMEGRNGVETVGQAFVRGGWGYEDRLFTVLLQEMIPRHMKDLPPRYYTQIVERLQNACGIVTMNA